MALLHVTRSNTRNARPFACVVESGHKTMHEAEVASVPGFPCSDLPFVYTELKRGRPGSIHHENEREVDVGGRG